MYDLNRMGLDGGGLVHQDNCQSWNEQVWMTSNKFGSPEIVMSWRGQEPSPGITGWPTHHLPEK